jgi:Patatin-like phospholipase
MPAELQPDQTPAHQVWVELATRITTQRLHYRSGEEETAARSVVDLFKRTRALMSEHPRARAFCALAERMLNTTIRPYTARWHGWMVDDRFPTEPRRRQFRRELQELRRKLVPYHGAFGQIAHASDATAAGAIALSSDSGANEERSEGEDGDLVTLLGGSIKAGIGTQISIPDETIDAMNAAEAREVIARRTKLGKSRAGDSTADSERPFVMDGIGLALSGGGIRSATFSLGVVQVLAQRKLLHEVDYISTVSGGGYLGSFLSCYLDDRVAGDPPSTEPDPVCKVAEAFEPTANGRESAPLRHLRNNSKYLTGSGGWQRASMLGLVLFGMLLNFIVIVPATAVAAACCWWMRDSLWAPAAWCAGGCSSWWDTAASPICIAVKVVAMTLGIVLLVLPLMQKWAWRQETDTLLGKTARTLECAAMTLALLLLAGAALAVLPAVFRAYATVVSEGASAGSWAEALSIGGAGAMPLVLGWLVAKLKPALAGKPGLLRQALTVLLMISGPIFYLLAFLFFGHKLGLGTCADGWPAGTMLWIAGGLIAWAWLCLNVNAFAPHRPYRNRLCECYLARWLPNDGGEANFARRSWLRQVRDWLFHGVAASTKGAVSSRANNNQVGTLTSLKLSKLSTTHTAPYHLLCGAVNLPASREKNLRGRSADFYLFSKHFCGSPVVGYEPTAKMEEHDEHLDLGTAMAISAAAASSGMGDKLPHLRFVLTLLNVRLGYWMPNPFVMGRSFLGPGPLYLLRELFGAAHERCRYVNVSDGGHIENLAIYELLRRRCKFIIATDGAQDANRTCEELRRLQRFAAIDLGVRIEIDVADLLPDERGISRSHAVLGKIHYYRTADGTARLDAEFGSGRDASEVGWLLYFKLGVTTAEPAYVRDYQRTHPDFPHQSTGDQIFEEAQFESYRALGETAAQSMLRPELLDVLGQNAEPLDIRKWFTAIAANLLPDNAR